MLMSHTLLKTGNLLWKKKARKPLNQQQDMRLPEDSMGQKVLEKGNIFTSRSERKMPSAYLAGLQHDLVEDIPTDHQDDHPAMVPFSHVGGDPISSGAAQTNEAKKADAKRAKRRAYRARKSKKRMEQRRMEQLRMEQLVEESLHSAANQMKHMKADTKKGAVRERVMPVTEAKILQFRRSQKESAEPRHQSVQGVITDLRKSADGWRDVLISSYEELIKEIAKGGKLRITLSQSLKLQDAAKIKNRTSRRRNLYKIENYRFMENTIKKQKYIRRRLRGKQHQRTLLKKQGVHRNTKLKEQLKHEVIMLQKQLGPESLAMA